MNIFIIGDSLSERMLVDKLTAANSSPRVYQWPRHDKSRSLDLGVSNHASFVEVGKSLSTLKIDFAINLNPNRLFAGLGNILEIYRIPLFGCNGLSLSSSDPVSSHTLPHKRLKTDKDFTQLLTNQHDVISYSVLVAKGQIVHFGFTQSSQIEFKGSDQYECTCMIESEISEEDIESHFIKPTMQILNESIRYDYSGWLQLDFSVDGDSIYVSDFKTVADRALLQTFTTCDERDWAELIANLLEINSTPEDISFRRQRNLNHHLGIYHEGCEFSLDNVPAQQTQFFEDAISSFTYIEGENGLTLMERLRSIFNRVDA